MPPALALLLCLGLVAASQVSITEFTVPAQAKVGEDIRLACHYKLEEKESDSFYVKWWWTPLDAGPEQKLLIYQGLGHMPKFIRRPPVVNVTDNDIQLGKLQPNYSGKYECEVFNDWHEDRQSSDLFVYSPGSGPQLNVSTVADGDDDTDVQVTCEATDVAPEPVLTISVGGEDVNFTDLVVSDPEDGLYSIAVNVTLEDIADGAEVRCSLIFANEAIAHEPYDATYTYHASGSEHTVLRTSWLLLATAAALSHLLAGVDRTL